MKTRQLMLLLVLWVGIVVVFPVSARRWKDRDEDERAAPSASLRLVAPTCLDTLNRGRELVLTEQDFSAITRADAGQEGSGAAAKKEMPNGFRIQCFASNTIEAVRAEKRQFESRLKYEAYIVFTEPYYKFHVGDFGTRGEAESALSKIRQEGYKEAWIVRSPVLVTERE